MIAMNPSFIAESVFILSSHSELDNVEVYDQDPVYMSIPQSGLIFWNTIVVCFPNFYIAN